jgi:folate-binding protein YgfZ
VIGSVAPRSAIGVTGGDRASYLQGLLTNDISSLTAGTGCYAAWLTPQGRMLTDLHVFESGDMILLDVPADLASATLARLDQFLFSEDVQLADLSATLTSVWIHGPSASTILERVISGASGLTGANDYANVRVAFGESPAVIARVDQLGVPGFCVYVQPDSVNELRRALESAGTVVADPAIIELARIEARYPVFGIDMTEDTIPLEAGIETRAISFTKGCYVGQEVIIRVLHRGHGRVARRLVQLRVEGKAPARGAKVIASEREIGWITSAADAPEGEAIALAYVHRDSAVPATRAQIEGQPATVQ